MNTRYYNHPQEIIRLAILLYVRYPLSLRQVEDLLAHRGIDVSYETIRRWWNRFGPQLASDIKQRRRAENSVSHWRWHLDEVFVQIGGERYYLWRAVDHEGEIIDAVVTKCRDRKTASTFLRKLLNEQNCAQEIVTDGLRSYGAVLTELGLSERQTTRQCANNRAENSHQVFRRRERSMQNFRSLENMQKFVSIHSQFTNHFNVQRHHIRRPNYKTIRDRSYAAWQDLCA